ncbi:uncharacterized protein [Clytia hemisphaerica]|uniref:uncharacterized protein n=1 Tax=Clytia hemisphaerica TaxID=252671 RepID=UPI0034D42A47
MNQPEWFNNDIDLKPGDIVLFTKQESSLASVYQYGMVLEIEESRDGKVRKATVENQNSNEKTKRETHRSVRSLVLIRGIDEMDLSTQFFENNQQLLKDYQKIFNEQLTKGVIEKAPNDQEVGKTHYIPHHAVIKPEKSTTKVRIVYDASAKANNNELFSLNECLEAGPPLNTDLFEILLRFRTDKVAIVGDIEKAVLHIKLNNEQRDLTRFLWFKNSDKIDFKNFEANEIVEYRMCRVLFGINASPFVLNATLQHHIRTANDAEFENNLIKSLHVDDLTTSKRTVAEAEEFVEKTKEHLSKASFNLRKFQSNSKELESKLQSKYGETENPTVMGKTKVLGVTWDKESDELCFQLKSLASLKPTKRNVLRALASIYDPLGLINPIVLTLKLYFQKLCLSKIDWDTPIEGDLLCEWQNLVKDFEYTQEIRVERAYSSVKQNVKEIQLHGYSDASDDAHGCCIYTRIVSKDGDIKTSLVTSKSHVNPIKTKSEVDDTQNGVVASFESLSEVPDPLTIPEKTGTNLKPFSDGVNKGPNLLNIPEEKDTLSFNISDGTEWITIPEAQSNLGEIIDVQRFRSFEQLLRVTGYVFKFVENIRCWKNKNNKQINKKQINKQNILNADDLLSAKKKWLLDAQRGIPDEMKKNLFLGGEVYRWKGRLNNAPIPFDAKHPIWLPTNSPLVDLLIKQAHDKVMHNGQRETLNELRSQFQIPRLRQRVRHFIYKCTICKKHGGKAYRYPESYDLPKSRLQVGAAFQNIGIDYCVPYLVYNVFDKTKEKFKFSLEKAPWFNGFTERLVKSVKTCLNKALNNKTLKYDEFLSLLIEIERTINNRPLTFIYDELTEEPLTPNHLLYGKRLGRNTNTTNDNSDSFELSENTKQAIEHFWKRWKTEYLLELRETHKKLARKNSSEMINENDIVLINEENVKRNDWRKGRVSKLLRGRDGKVRGAELVVVNKYGNGILRRPINKLFPFEYHHSRVSDDKNDQEVKIKFIDERDLPSCVGV